VLDLNCRAHDVDNLYVVDGSFFVSSGAVNPTLTIVANALRVGDHLLDRLRAQGAAVKGINRTLKQSVAPDFAAMA
jgi:choline dehydrogenase-like flavoprotein